MFAVAEFAIVNRAALTLRAKPPVNAWLISIEPDEDFSEDLQDCDVYLLPEYEELEQIEIWLKKNFDRIFIEQLNNWYTDETLWPKNRTFKMFKEWFECSLSTIVCDTQTKQLSKD